MPLPVVAVDVDLEVVDDAVVKLEEAKVVVAEVAEVEVVAFVVVVESEGPVSSAATSFEKYEGRVFQGLPPPALVM